MRKPQSASKTPFYQTQPFYYLIIGLIALLIGYFVWSYYHNTEKVTSTYYIPKPRVRLNPYYAAETLLNHYHKQYLTDIDTTASDVSNNNADNPFAKTLNDIDLKLLIDDLPELPDPSQNGIEQSRPTIILHSVGSQLTEANFETLRAWIEAGGHLITYTGSYTDNEELQEVIDQAQLLSANGATRSELLADTDLQSMIDALSSDNKFLARLGIYATSFESSEDTQDNFEVLDKELSRLNIDSNNRQVSVLKRILRNQNLSVLYAESNTNQQKGSIQDNNTDRQNVLSDDILLINTDNQDNYLNDELFDTLYADKLSPSSDIDRGNSIDHALLIRTYLKQQRQFLLPLLNDIETDRSNGVTYASGSAQAQKQKRVLMLNTVINTLLKMNDEVLVTLFKPMDEVYLDHKFGQGRISVIIDNGIFTNPSPNSVVLDQTVGETSDDQIPVNYDNQSSILPVHITVEDILINSNGTDLYHADNAQWLVQLTQNSKMVWILPNTDIDPLPVILWKQARLAILGFGLLMLVWLWSLYNRFGKMQHLSQSHAHDILYYFRQVGRYGWQRDNAQRLNKATQERILIKVREALRYHQPVIDANAKEDKNSGNLTSNNQFYNKTTKSHHETEFNIIAHIKDLHTLLIERLREQRDLKDGSEATEFAKQNYAFIHSLIKPSRLHQALSKRATAHAMSAAEFTQNTQTLWAIAWLLQ